MAFHQYFSASTLLTFWPDTFLMQGQSWTCEVSEHVQVSWTSQVSTHQCLNASMTSAPAVTTKHTCTCGPVSLGGRSCLQPLAHMIQLGLFPTQPPWPQVSHTEASFFFTWLLFEHMKRGPTSGPLQPLFSWLGVLVLLSAPRIYGGFLPAFFWVCSNVPKGRVFLLPPYVMATLGLPWWCR